MSVRVVGAGLYRTGTKSLKTALETLLGEPAYHMAGIFLHPEHIPTWHAAALGEEPDWPTFLRGYGATLDTPAAYFWPEIAAAFPDAIVLLSSRSEESWRRSASQTVLKTEGMVSPEWDAMNTACRNARFSTRATDKASMIRGYQDHNAAVRANIEPKRLLEWTIGDGWEPICSALRLDIPDTPFPYVNSTEEWLARERQNRDH